MVFIDFNSAFDSEDHSIMFKWGLRWFGIKRSVVNTKNWLYSSSGIYNDLEKVEVGEGVI